MKKLELKLKLWRSVLISLRAAQGIAIPAVQSMRVGRVLRKLQDELILVDEQQNAIAKKHGTRDKETGNYSLVGADAVDAFEEEMKAVLDEPLEIEFQPITRKSLEKYDIPPSFFLYHELFED